MSEFTLNLVNEAIAAAVKAVLPGVTVYDNPNQQKTKLPAIFITYRGEQKLNGQVGARWLRKLRFDLYYMEKLNLPDLGDRYRSAAEALDEGLDTIPFVDGLPLRTEKRNWFVELDGLHYQFDLNVRLSKSVETTAMGAIEGITEGVKD